jgi:hypothetical protein
MTNFQKQKSLSLSLGFNSNLKPQQTNKKNIPITIGITLPIPYKQKSPFLGKEWRYTKNDKPAHVLVPPIPLQIHSCPARAILTITQSENFNISSTGTLIHISDNINTSILMNCSLQGIQGVPIADCWTVPLRAWCSTLPKGAWCSTVPLGAWCSTVPLGASRPTVPLGASRQQFLGTFLLN